MRTNKAMLLDGLHQEINFIYRTYDEGRYSLDEATEYATACSKMYLNTLSVLKEHGGKL